MCNQLILDTAPRPTLTACAPPRQGDTVRVIWAYGREDPDKEGPIRMHDERGTKSLYLMEPRVVLPAMGEDVRTWEIMSPNVRRSYTRPRQCSLFLSFLYNQHKRICNHIACVHLSTLKGIY